MNSTISVKRPRRVLRVAGAGVLVTALSACGVSRVDEVSVKWPSFKSGTPVVLPSDPAQCPDLTGTYRAQGEFRSGDRETTALNDLRNFFLYTLDLPGMRDTLLPEWRSTPEATVALARVEGGWRVSAQDGQGARSTAQLPMLNGAQDPAALSGDANANRPDGVRRHTGCTQGRLWVSVRNDWRQYESMGVRRHVAIFRSDAGGLLVTVQRESDSIGMLPWYSNEGSVSQVWFARAAP